MARTTTDAHSATMHLMVGLPGAGKTTAARAIAAGDGALLLSPDEWMIPLFGDSDAGGRRDVLEGRLISAGLDAVRLGLDVVLDFGFWGREERWALLALAALAGGVGRVMYLPIDLELQRQRVATRWADTPERTFVISDDDLIGWRAVFEEPDADELVGRHPAVPAAGGSWATWAAARWPSLVAPTAPPPTLSDVLDA